MRIKAKNIRRRTEELIYKASAPHIGSALSCIEILTALYECVDIKKIVEQKEERDRIILSKGHAIAAQLAALCEFGLLNEVVIDKFCVNGTPFFENTSPYTPFIEAATGSLGQGISYGVGIALGMRLKGYFHSKVYIVVGDGELNEGQCWEAIQQASRLALNNLCILIDNNQLSGIQNNCGNGNWINKFISFGFDIDEVDGHDVEDIYRKISVSDTQNRPIALLCHTIKGKGISFMENNNDWHYRPISNEIHEIIIKELGEKELL